MLITEMRCGSVNRITAQEMFLPFERDVLYVVAWDYYENANRLEGGGGGQEWHFEKAAALEVFAWAQMGWGDHPITIRLVEMRGPKGHTFTRDNEVLARGVSDALDLMETPDKYPSSWTLIAECKWHGGAS